MWFTLCETKLNHYILDPKVLQNEQFQMRKRLHS
jgi:hypothetical protein